MQCYADPVTFHQLPCQRQLHARWKKPPPRLGAAPAASALALHDAVSSFVAMLQRVDQVVVGAAVGVRNHRSESPATLLRSAGHPWRLSRLAQKHVLSDSLELPRSHQDGAGRVECPAQPGVCLDYSLLAENLMQLKPARQLELRKSLEQLHQVQLHVGGPHVFWEMLEQEEPGHDQATATCQGSTCPGEDCSLPVMRSSCNECIGERVHFVQGDPDHASVLCSLPAPRPPALDLGCEIAAHRP